MTTALSTDVVARYKQLRDEALGYEVVGAGYAGARKTEPTWEARIRHHLGDAAWVCNVGAGAGSYETAHPRVLAVEPSAVMRSQRAQGPAPCISGRAEDLPFDDDSFDVAMAILTVHHWSDLERGLRELRRVGRRYLVLTYDMSVQREFWLTRDYIPEIAVAEQQRVPTMETVLEHLGPSRVETLMVPAECEDGFVTAFWRRPWALLDPAVRSTCSALALTDGAAVDRGLAQLAEDLDSGVWQRKHAALLAMPAWDAGFRLLTGPA